MSPWTTPWWCSTVSASATWAIQRSTVDTGSPGRPSSASTRARSTPSTQSRTSTWRSSWTRSSRAWASPGAVATTTAPAPRQELLCRTGRRQDAHLEGDDPLVPGVDRLEHGRLTAATEHLHRFVAIGDRGSHPWCPRRSAQRRVITPRRVRRWRAVIAGVRRRRCRTCGQVREVQLDRVLGDDELCRDLPHRRRLGEDVAARQRPAQRDEHVVLAGGDRRSFDHRVRRVPADRRLTAEHERARPRRTSSVGRSGCIDVIGCR